MLSKNRIILLVATAVIATILFSSMNISSKKPTGKYYTNSSTYGSIWTLNFDNDTVTLSYNNPNDIHNKPTKFLVEKSPSGFEDEYIIKFQDPLLYKEKEAYYNSEMDVIKYERREWTKKK